MTPKKKIICDESDSEDEDVVFSPIDATKKIHVEKTSDYELKRQERMKENLAALKDLGISDIINTQNCESVQVEAKKRVINKKRREKLKRRRVIRQRERQANRGSRKSLRSSPRLNPDKKSKTADEVSELIEGFDIAAIAGMVNKVVKKINLTTSYIDEDDSDASADDEDLLEEEKKELAFTKSLQDRYYTCEEYFTLKGIKPEFIQEHGSFIGWVEEDLRKKVGIASDRESAWESNGGGTFSFKTPTGVNILKSQSAKETARKMLFKNPNSYFYRHTAPGYDHWQGDWTEPENERFLEVAKVHGVGNKWGLFATYIPHRVGYQCSNYYRSHFVEGGIIWDGNFMLDKYGKSIYVGRKNKFV